MRVTDEEHWERFVLISKPEQSGKTFIMLQKMIQFSNEYCDIDASVKKVVNFIFCDNSLLLVKQTSKRVGCDMKSFNLNNEVYVEFSSRDGAVNNIDKITTDILLQDIRNIICCSNSKRIKSICKCIESFNASPNTTEKYEFKIWLDEADRYIKYIDNHFKPLVDEHDNVHVYCMTATPERLFKTYNQMNVLPIEKTTRPDYHGWVDNNRIILEHSSDTVAFVHHVLNKYVDQHTMCKGSKWYIPGNHKKETHHMIKDLLLLRGFAVFVINGDGITLSLPPSNTIEGIKTIHEHKTEELNKQIMRMYHENKVERFPVAITGKICVGRGISIMSPEFIFDYAILSNCTNKADASQNAGRTKGNIKTWPMYKPIIVYTTKKFDAVATELEIKSRNLAELAYKNDEVYSSIITKQEFKDIGDDRASDFDHKEFETDKAAINWVLKTFNYNMSKSPPEAPKTLRTNDDKNPTLEYVIRRKWGLKKNTTAIRKIQLDNKKVCVYWRPSTMVCKMREKSCDEIVPFA
jgi:hypothetical protein